MRKRFTLLTLTFFLSVLVGSFMAEGARFVNGKFEYEVRRFYGHDDADEVVIVGRAPGATFGADLTLPATVTNAGTVYTVVGLGNSVYDEYYWEEGVISGLTDIQTVTIPASYRMIGIKEFIDCPNITRYTVAEGNEDYSSDDSGCLYEDEFEDGRLTLLRYPSALTSATFALPYKANWVGPGAFAANTHLKKVYLSGDQQLQHFWQLGNKSITSVDVTSANGYTSPQEGVIYRHGSLESVCPGLKLDEYKVPQMSVIPEAAFCNSSIKKVVLNGPTRIDSHAFAFSDVEAVTFSTRPCGYIAYGAFLCAKKIKQISLGAQANGKLYIGSQAFLGCESLERISFDSGITSVEFKDQIFRFCKKLADFPLPANVTIPCLEQYAFAGCESLTKFPLGQVEEIAWEGSQFAGSGYTILYWPKALPEVPNFCFENCRSLTKINLKMETKRLGNRTFAGTALTAISMMGVEQYWRTTFADCPNLKRVYFPDNDADNVTFYAIPFQNDNAEVIVNKGEMWSLDDQIFYPSPLPNIYLSAFSPAWRTYLGTAETPSWNDIYVPGGSRAIWENLAKRPVKVMYTYQTIKAESTVILGRFAPGVRITGVTIEGIDATSDDGLTWRANTIANPDDKMNVTVSYSVNGNPMSTTYEYPQEELEASIDSIRGIDSVISPSIIYRDAQAVILSAPAQWQVHSLSGALLAGGHGDTIDLASLPAGVTLLSFPEIALPPVKLIR